MALLPLVVTAQVPGANPSTPGASGPPSQSEVRAGTVREVYGPASADLPAQSPPHRHMTSVPGVQCNNQVFVQL